MDVIAIYKLIDSVIELLTFGVALYASKIISNQYSRNRSKMSNILRYFFVIFGLMPVMQFLDGVFYPSTYSVRYGYAFIILISAGANFLLLEFTIEVFLQDADVNKKFWKMYKIIYIPTDSVVVLIGFALKIQNKVVTTYLGIHFIISMGLYLTLMNKSFKLAKKVEEELFKKAIRSIGLFASALLLVYIFFIADSFYKTYSIWGVLGWLFYFIAAIYSAYGFIGPIIAKNKAAQSA